MSSMSSQFVLRSALGLTLVAAAAWMVGCRGESQPAVPAAHTGQSAANEDVGPMAGGQKAADAGVPPGLVGLSEQDRELALTQRVCPVSGDVLGIMSAPIKLNVGGQDVLICCPICKEPLENDPAAYLTKLGIEPAAQ